MNFKNKRVWITGASSGIGEGLAYAFAEQGANLILSARNETELARVKANCDQVEVLTVKMDIGDHKVVFETIADVLAKVGKIDILINNAGVSQRDLAMNTHFKVDKQLIDVNYLGTVAVTKAILPSMVLHQLGHIVTITSATGKFGSPLRSSYAASKHALHGFFDSLRAELIHDNIKIMLVCPGFIRTNISKNALVADGKKQGTMDEATNNGLEPKVLANKILRGISNGKEELHVGGLKEMFAIQLKRFFPRFFSRMIAKANVT
jgi:dehydrogenase/reductase SDR family member 7B